MSDDIYCYLTRLPKGIHEMVAPCPDGSYTVYLEITMTREQQQRAYQHALRHILNDDCFQEKSVDNIEYEAHLEGLA